MTKVKTSDVVYRALGCTAIISTFGVFGGWAAYAPLDSSVVTQGKVELATKNQSVQHLDGGKIAEILVREGQWIREGETLFVLDTKEMLIRHKQLEEQLFETKITIERLNAEVRQQDQLTFSEELATQLKDPEKRAFLDTQKRLFDTRKASFFAEQNALLQRIAQSEKQIDTALAQIENTKNRRVSFEEDVRVIKVLAEKKLAKLSTVRSGERAVEELSARILSYEGEISRLTETISETRARMISAERSFVAQSVKELQLTQQRQIDIRANIASLEEQIKNAVVSAPMDGKVKSLSVNTLGSIISAGDTLMEIVPEVDDVQIIARIAPTDIDNVYPGTKAETRFSVLDGFQDLPTMYGIVEDVSTDAFDDERGQGTYYKATLKIAPNSLSLLMSETDKLVSGMPVEVLMKTGERTLLEYLISPIKDTIVKAFNEV